jgi:uncharacterized protein YehS (DUF1456 family)
MFDHCATAAGRRKNLEYKDNNIIGKKLKVTFKQFISLKNENMNETLKFNQTSGLEELKTILESEGHPSIKRNIFF